MKTTRRFIAMTAALTLTACAAMPMTMVTANATANTISVKSGSETTGTHTYTAYRIFNGSASESGFGSKVALGNPTWAGTEGKLDDFIAALNSNSAFGNDFSSAATVGDIVTVLSGYSSNDTKAKAFAKFCADGAETYGLQKTVGSVGGSITVNTDGYYVVADTSPATSIPNGARTAYLLGVYDAETGAEITLKSALPTVEKKVWDDADSSTEGWYDTADHAINETFQYKLTATIPADEDIAEYSKYRIKFNDKLNEGVTYDGGMTVKVKCNGKTDVDVPVYNASTAKSGYRVTQPSSGDYNLTIEIGDVFEYLPTGAKAGTDAITVEVIYDAHLNANAEVRKATAESIGTDDKNVNSVNLEYSNNPNVIGSGDSNSPTADENNNHGTTTPDYTWTLTYEVDNTKYKNSKAEENRLAGAGFTLYTDAACTAAKAVKLINNGDGTYTVASTTAELTASPKNAKDEIVTEMFSYDDSSNSNAKTGIFNIKGLDYGTYYLKETSTPAGYNTCDNITITLTPNHEKNADVETAKLTWTDTGESPNVINANNDVYNKSGSTLPSTGGIGTTLFFLGGGCLAGLTGVLLITKKRTKDAEANPRS